MTIKTQTIQIEVKHKALANPRCPDKMRYDLMLSSDVNDITYSAKAHYFINKKGTAAGLDFGGQPLEDGKDMDCLFIGSLTNMAILIDGNNGLSAKNRDLLMVRKAYVNGLLKKAFTGWAEGVTSVQIDYESDQTID